MKYRNKLDPNGNASWKSRYVIRYAILATSRKVVRLVYEDAQQKVLLKSPKDESVSERVLRWEECWQESVSELHSILDDDSKKSSPIWPAHTRRNIQTILEGISTMVSERFRPFWFQMIRIARYTGLGIVAYLVYFIGFRDVKAASEFKKQHPSTRHDTSNQNQEEESALLADGDERWT